MQTQQAEKRSSNKITGVLNLAIGIGLLTSGTPRFLSHPSHLVGILQSLLGLLLFLSGLFAFVGLSSLGSVGHEQVFDLEIEKRARERYQTEIDELSRIGFTYSFTETESFSSYRVFLIYPALVLIMMLVKREVLALQGGKILIAMPIFRSVDGRTFGHPFGLGVKFQTAFQNGLLLTTKTFGDECCDTPEFVLQSTNKTISETWETHQAWIGRLDTENNPAKRDSSYQAYEAISRQEGVLLRSLDKS